MNIEQLTNEDLLTLQATIKARLRKAGVKSIGSNNGIDWVAQDWGKPDAELSEALGVTRQRVHQVRQTLGKPSVYVYDQRYKDFAARFKGTKTITMNEYKAASSGGYMASGTTFNAWCEKAGIKVLRSKYKAREQRGPIPHMNFEIPDIILASIWGVAQATINHHRHHRGLGKPKFRVYAGDYPFEFLDLVNEEREKAKAYEQSKRTK